MYETEDWIERLDELENLSFLDYEFGSMEEIKEDLLQIEDKYEDSWDWDLDIEVSYGKKPSSEKFEEKHSSITRISISHENFDSFNYQFTPGSLRVQNFDKDDLRQIDRELIEYTTEELGLEFPKKGAIEKVWDFI